MNIKCLDWRFVGIHVDLYIVKRKKNMICALVHDCNHVDESFYDGRQVLLCMSILMELF